jgi:hypothetical protein
MQAYIVKFNLSCLYICLVLTTVFMNITMYILTINYTAVILISTYQAIFVTDNGSEYIFRLMPVILIPFPDIHVQIYCL